MLAIVEELLVRDLVVLDRVDTDFFEGDALADGFAGNVEGEVDGELIGVRAVAFIIRSVHRFVVWFL